LSVDGGGNLAENVGTSFAAPLVASLAANVMQEVDEESMPHLLTRAMLLHFAFINNAPIGLDSLHYTGVGRPPDLAEILYCRQTAATIVLRADLGEEPIAVKQRFPIPPCLVNQGSLRAEILMTLAYLPPFDSRAGFEYCRTNVDAKLGTLDATGGFQSQVPTAPKLAEAGWEEHLIKHGYKWSPTKFYYRNLLKQNTLGSREWELRLNLHRRSGVPRVDTSHIAYLLITIRDQRGGATARIYDQMVQMMTRLGWGADDLKLRTRGRFRA
jgi:hypothetical protein